MKIKTYKGDKKMNRICYIVAEYKCEKLVKIEKHSIQLFDKETFTDFINKFIKCVKDTVINVNYKSKSNIIIEFKDNRILEFFVSSVKSVVSL